MRNLGVGKMCLLFCVLLGACIVVLAPGVPGEGNASSADSSLNEPLTMFARKSDEI